MRIVRCEQGSAEWFEARAGKVTASEVADALRFLKKGENKGEEGKTRAKYKLALASEILTGRTSDTFVSSYMQRGTEMEPLARTAYEMKFGLEVDRVGFGIHGAIDRFGASPDGLVGKDGGVEFKCPTTENHFAYMDAGRLPSEYEPQVMACISVFEREWWDFMSYDNRPISRRFHIFALRVYRDEARIKQIEDGVKNFLQEVDDLIGRLQSLNPEPDELKRNLRASLDDGLGITDEDITWIQQQHGDVHA